MKNFDMFAKSKIHKDGLYPSCKECKNRLSAKRYEINRVSILEKQKKRRMTDPESKRLSFRIHYQKNKKAILEKNKKWKLENKDRIRENHLKYSETRREIDNEKSRKWFKDNPERAIIIRKNSVGKRRSKVLSGCKTSDLAVWQDSQEKICFYCNSECASKFEIDHFIPLAKGGVHEIENLRISCSPCNRSKSARDPYEFLEWLGKSGRIKIPIQPL